MRASECALETPYFTHWFKDFLSMQRQTARAGMNKLVTDTHTCAAARSKNLHTGPSWGFSPSLLENAPQSRSIKIGPVQHTGHITHTHSRSGSRRASEWKKTHKKTKKHSHAPQSDSIETVV